MVEVMKWGNKSSVTTQIGSVGLGYTHHTKQLNLCPSIPVSCKVIYNPMSGCPGEM